MMPPYSSGEQSKLCTEIVLLESGVISATARPLKHSTIGRQASANSVRLIQTDPTKKLRLGEFKIASQVVLRTVETTVNYVEYPISQNGDSPFVASPKTSFLEGTQKYSEKSLMGIWGILDQNVNLTLLHLSLAHTVRCPYCLVPTTPCFIIRAGICADTTTHTFSYSLCWLSP